MCRFSTTKRAASKLWAFGPPPKLGMGAFGAPLFGPEWGLWPEAQNGSPKWPFFHGLGHLFGVELENTKIVLKTPSGSTKKCMLCKACVFTNLVVAKGKVHNFVFCQVRDAGKQKRARVPISGRQVLSCLFHSKKKTAFGRNASL